MICKCCFGALENFHQMKKRANESQIVINYIAKKKVSEIGNINI